MATPTLSEFEHEIGARIARGDFTAASAAAAACRSAWPKSSAGWLLGSFAALCEGNAAGALELIEVCLRADPGNLQGLLQQAECLIALGRRSDALAAAAKVGSSPNADLAALQAAGQFLAHARALAEALAVFDRAVDLAPRNLEIWAQRAALHQMLGQFDLAARDYESVLDFIPRQADALKGLAELEPQTSARNRLKELDAALDQATPGSIDAAVLNFALAKCHDDLGAYAASWRHLVKANRLERARSDYRPDSDRSVVEELIAGFPEIETERPDLTHERPIFIVGLPRTGSTLIERILASHSQVDAAGELPALSQAIGRAFNRAPQGTSRHWREFAARLNLLDAETVAREYLALARPQRGYRARFSDKQPTNFFYCALIMRAFPHAHIVHLTRHPLAACYAMFKTRFDAGFPFAYDLEELGEFYIGYRRLMAHWHRILPGRIVDVAYEDLVSAQESTTRRLLDRLDLPFEAASLEFHRNPSPTTNTKSSRQVRQPIYASSLEHWRHYASELEPLRDKLARAGIAAD